MLHLPIEPKDLSTEARELDCRFWESVVDTQPTVQSTFPTDADRVVGNDLFNTLYHFRPRLKDSPPEPARAKALDKLMGTSEWMRLHDSTMGDDTLAAAGATTLRQRLEQDPNTAEVAKALKELEEARQLQQQLQELTEGQELTPTQQEVADQAALDAVALTSKVETALEDRQVMAAIHRAAGETTTDLQTAQEVAAGWGNDPGTLQQALFDPELSRHLREDYLRRILDLAGRMQDTIASTRAKRPRPGPQQVKIGIGDDISRLVPTELAMYGDPETEDVFLRRYTERSLMLYERQEKPRQGKGPFVICVDESTSMKGTKIQWAKALAFALCQQAHREKRPFAAIAFASTLQQRTIAEPNPPEFIEWMGDFFNGGTDFSPPLFKATSLIKTRLPDADIVLVTDGECEIPEQTISNLRQLWHEHSVKVIGVQIGGSSLDSLRTFCDAVFRLDVAGGPAGLEAVIEEMR